MMIGMMFLFLLQRKKNLVVLLMLFGSSLKANSIFWNYLQDPHVRVPRVRTKVFGSEHQ